ncbi:MAG: hypothetical protein ABIY70_16715 [Capsulimonas sp.]|uniref:hypothetical protein n=1 Tax=Capsulimonas sp. TaxID=2494211 RepID=UPI003265EA5B
MIVRFWKCSSYFAVLFMMVVLSGGSIPRASAATRALWVWNGDSIVASSAQQTQFFNFVAAPYGKTANKVGKLYFFGGLVSQFSSSTWTSQMRSFLSTAHAKGISVFYLCGDSSWATAAHENDGLAYVSAFLSFNAASAAGTRFDGFQFDVEPYTLPGWPSTALENGLLDLLYRARNLITASGQQIPLSAAIPFWLDQSQFNYLDRGVIDLTDEVAIMDYTNNATNLTSFPQAEMAYASAHNKPVWIGVETTNAGSTVSFYGKGDAYMENMLTSDLTTFQSRPSFAGYAIHDYLGWVNLGP